MANKKITKSEKYTMLENILANMEGDNIPMLVEFVQAEKAALANKAAKAKAKAAEKKTEIDELGNAVLAVVTDEPMGRDQITDLVDFEDKTVAKVGARLNKLVELGLVAKAETKATSAAGKKTTRMVYTKVTADAE